jgi:succinyl-CoA synthetase alpha subunit
MIEAGTPLVGGVALGRGGTAMDGLPLYDRIAELPQKPNIALIYTPAEGVQLTSPLPGPLYIPPWPWRP